MTNILTHLMDLRKEPEQFLFVGFLYKTIRSLYLRDSCDALDVSYTEIPKDTILLLVLREKIQNRHIKYEFIANDRKYFHTMQQINEKTLYEYFTGVRE